MDHTQSPVQFELAGPEIVVELKKTDPITTVPATYLQTLFLGLLGKFITTSHFPITPMGLIQVGQSFEQTRAVTTEDIHLFYPR